MPLEEEEVRGPEKLTHFSELLMKQKTLPQW